MNRAKIKVNWEAFDRYFIISKFQTMTWEQLLAAVNETRTASEQVELGALRHECRRLGLYKNRLVHWSEEDERFLFENYRRKGNVEIAIILSKKKRSSRMIDGELVTRKFNKKHVEKKMKLLKLCRTKAEILAIKKRNKTIGLGSFFTSEKNQWTMGHRHAASENEIRTWKDQTGVKKKVIKINGKFTPYTRWFYNAFIEPVLPDEIIYHKDTDTLNDTPENLAKCKRQGLHSTERFEEALRLLNIREEKILKELPKMRDSSKEQREEISRKMAELNRIRNLTAKVLQKLHRIYGNKIKKTA